METPRDTSMLSSTATPTTAINRNNDREATSMGLLVDTDPMHSDDGPVVQASNDKDDQILKKNDDQKYPVMNNDTDGDDNNNLLAVSAKQQLQESKNEDSTMPPPILHRHSNVLQRMITPGAYPSDQQQQSLQQQLPPSSPLDTAADNLPVLEATLVTSTGQDVPAPVLLVAHVSDEVILAEVIPHNNNNKNNDDKERKKHRRRSRYRYILFAMLAFCITVVSCVLITLRVQEDDQRTHSCGHGNRCPTPNDTKPNMTYHALIYGGSITSCQSYQLSPIVITCGGKSIIGNDDDPSILPSPPVINVTFIQNTNSNQTNTTCHVIGTNAVQCHTTMNRGQQSHRRTYLNMTYSVGIIFSCSHDDFIDGYHVATTSMTQPSYGYQCTMNDTPSYMSHYMGLGHYCQLNRRDDTMSLIDNIVIENGTTLVNQCESPNETYIGSNYVSSSGSKLKENYFDFCYQRSNASTGSCIDESSNCNENENNTNTPTSIELLGMNSTDAFSNCETSLANEQTITNLKALLGDLISSSDNIAWH